MTVIALLRTSIIANLDLWQAGLYRYDEHGTALPSTKTRPLTADSRMQVTEYETMTDQARSDVAIAKIYGHHH